jgi:molybdopterin molybdotransferase
MPGPPYGPDHVRPAGSDFAAGDVLVEAGLELTPQRLVAAAAADLSQVTVWRRPRVAVLSTGDELAEPGQARARPGAIAESISPAILAQVARWGGEPLGRRICGDDLPRLEGVAAELVGAADLVVVCGGASVGERDYSRAMFAPLGLRIVFSKTAIKPGKPVWLGRIGETLVLGLPGNPTSALVTARLFMAPLLAVMTGRPASALLRWWSEPLDGELPQTDERETFHRARRTARGVQPLPDQSSGAQKMLGLADVLIRRRPAEAAAASGDEVMALDL